MKILFTSYINVNSFNDSQQWLERIKGYIGVLESLSKYHTIISIEQINYNGELEKNGVKYYFLNFKKSKSLFPLRLHRFVKKIDPDIIIVHGTHFPLQLIQLKKTIRKNVKIIVQNHAEKHFNWPRNYLQKLADKYIDAYMFTSKEMGEEWIIKGIISSRKKIWGVMEASSVFKPINTTVAKARTAAEGSSVFLWVGRLDENKDPLTVVKAFLQFNKYNAVARLYMIYHTTDLLEQICELLERENSNNSVVLIGKLLHDEMLYWYNSAGFIISGSHYEGSGVAVCEAMSCGCIPIVTDIPSFRKLTGYGKCGMLYEKGNVAALLGALIKTQQINITEERDKVLQQFHSELSFNAIAEQISELITGLCT